MNNGNAMPNADEGEQPVVDEHRDGHGDHERAVEEPGDTAPREELRERLDVGRDPRDQGPAPLVGVVGD